MVSDVRQILAGITTVGDMIEAFQDGDRCRPLLEATIWPRVRICPHVATGTRWSLRGAASVGERARASINARTVTADFSSRDDEDAAAFDEAATSGLADRLVAHPAVRQGISSVRLSEAIGVSQPTA